MTRELNESRSSLIFDLPGKMVLLLFDLKSLCNVKVEMVNMPFKAKMNIITGDDFAKAKIVGCWKRFRLKDGMFSRQLIIGNSLVVTEPNLVILENVIPRSEWKMDL